MEERQASLDSNVPAWLYPLNPPAPARTRRQPDVYACGFCHTPGGQGRPENASLAGLPAEYILSQLADFRSGKRRSAWSGPYRPVDRMIHAVTFATDEELRTAAEYFSAQVLRARVEVIEQERVPRLRCSFFRAATPHTSPARYLQSTAVLPWLALLTNERLTWTTSVN